MVALKKDERGITVITFVLVLPIFLLIIFGMFEIWKIISVRESLHLGMRKVAVYLTETKEGRNLAKGAWEDKAEEIILSDIRNHNPRFFVELKNNPFVSDNVVIQDDDVHVAVYEDIDRPLDLCKWLFTATVEFPWTAVIPYIPGSMKLAEQTTSYIRCTKYEIP